jgi:modulator of drug activity B
MQDKKFMVAATWNAPTEAFDNPEGVLFEGKGIDDLLLSITSNYRFVGFEVLKSYGIHDIFKDTADIPTGLEHYRDHLAAIALGETTSK